MQRLSAVSRRRCGFALVPGRYRPVAVPRAPDDEYLPSLLFVVLSSIYTRATSSRIQPFSATTIGARYKPRQLNIQTSRIQPPPHYIALNFIHYTGLARLRLPFPLAPCLNTTDCPSHIRSCHFLFYMEHCRYSPRMSYGTVVLKSSNLSRTGLHGTTDESIYLATVTLSGIALCKTVLRRYNEA